MHQLRTWTQLNPSSSRRLNCVETICLTNDFNQVSEIIQAGSEVEQALTDKCCVLRIQLPKHDKSFTFVKLVLTLNVKFSLYTGFNVCFTVFEVLHMSAASSGYNVTFT